MLYSGLTFSNPIFLWGLLALPLLALLFFLYKHSVYVKNSTINNFADLELLPHLLKTRKHVKQGISIYIIWSLLWSIGVIAMAGPRWKFKTYETYQTSAAAVVIVLDLSQSMNAEDIKPNRITRAKQAIQDILAEAHDVRIGMIVFAEVSHLITPITDDFATIQHLLPAIDVKLIHKQGSRILPALKMAKKLLGKEPGKKKHILLISDGDFSDNYLDSIDQLISASIRLHVMGIGTQVGAPFKNSTGDWQREKDQVVIAKLAKHNLQIIAKKGDGFYWEPSYRLEEILAWLRIVKGFDGGNLLPDTTVKQWEEGFFWFIVPMLVLSLWMYRKQLQYGMLLIPLVVFSAFPNEIKALDLFKNSDQKAKTLYQEQHYSESAYKFTDPYRQGVALFRAQRYLEAEVVFRKSNRAEMHKVSCYNLGNAQVMQKKYIEAIATYNLILHNYPDDDSTQHNLSIAKQLLKQNPKSPIQDSHNKDSEQTKESKMQEESNAPHDKSGNAENRTQSVVDK